LDPAPSATTVKPATSKQATSEATSSMPAVRPVEYAQPPAMRSEREAAIALDDPSGPTIARAAERRSGDAGAPIRSLAPERAPSPGTPSTADMRSPRGVSNAKPKVDVRAEAAVAIDDNAAVMSPRGASNASPKINAGPETATAIDDGVAIMSLLEPSPSQAGRKVRPAQVVPLPENDSADPAWRTEADPWGDRHDLRPAREPTINGARTASRRALPRDRNEASAPAASTHRTGAVEIRIGTISLQVRAPQPAAPAPEMPARESFAPYRHYLRSW
jgi:hypothetical protein